MCGLLFLAWRGFIDPLFLDDPFSFFFWCGTALAQSVSSPLSVFSLSPLLFFIRHQRMKLKQESAPQLPWHAFPFSLKQKSELRDASKALKANSSKKIFWLSLHFNYITSECQIIFQHLFYCAQHRRQIFHFVYSLIAPLSDSLAFLFCLIKTNYEGNVWGAVTA